MQEARLFPAPEQHGDERRRPPTPTGSGSRTGRTPGPGWRRARRAGRCSRSQPAERRGEVDDDGEDDRAAPAPPSTAAASPATGRKARATDGQHRLLAAAGRAAGGDGVADHRCRARPRPMTAPNHAAPWSCERSQNASWKNMKPTTARRIGHRRPRRAGGSMRPAASVSRLVGIVFGDDFRRQPGGGERARSAEQDRAVPERRRCAGEFAAGCRPARPPRHR